MPTDGTGLPFDGSGDFGASPFLGQLSDKQSARPSQHATPFPFQHLMNNFRFGATHRGTTEVGIENGRTSICANLSPIRVIFKPEGSGSRRRVSSCSAVKRLSAASCPRPACRA